MTRRLHTRSKIFFNNPYVVRVEYTNGPAFIEAAFENHYRKLCKKIYLLIGGTWGHSPLINDVFAEDDLSIKYTVRGYFVFQDKSDALQFKLSCDITNIRVFMWPSKIDFTIHEFVEDSTLQQAI
jgi:hypothetical protein